MYACTFVPSITRTRGAGTSSGWPATANALTSRPGDCAPSGRHSPSLASSRTVSVLASSVPALLRLSLATIGSSVSGAAVTVPETIAGRSDEAQHVAMPRISAVVITGAVARSGPASSRTMEPPRSLGNVVPGSAHATEGLGESFA